VAKVVAFIIIGFCKVEVNEFTPVHAYEVPPLLDRVKVEPTQIGVLLLAVAVGMAFTVAEVVAIAVHPLTLVTTT
jgi:hypothetical protein